MAVAARAMVAGSQILGASLSLLPMLARAGGPVKPACQAADVALRKTELQTDFCRCFTLLTELAHQHDLQFGGFRAKPTPHVLGGGDGLQVLWVAAPTIAAQVVEQRRRRAPSFSPPRPVRADRSDPARRDGVTVPVELERAQGIAGLMTKAGVAPVDFNVAKAFVGHLRISKRINGSPVAGCAMVGPSEKPTRCSHATATVFGACTRLIRCGNAPSISRM